MRINSINTNAYTNPNFKATLKANEIVKDLYSYANNHEKELLQKNLNLFNHVSKDDVVELRKVDGKNMEEYNLVNVNYPEKQVTVCSLFKNIKTDNDKHSDLHKLQSKMGYIRESLIEVLQEAVNNYSNTFKSLFR